MAQKILVIDESNVAARLTETVLAKNFATCDVMLAPRGIDGIERFHLANPDLILLDDSLPDLDGDAVCYRLLNDPFMSKVPVIVISANGTGPALVEKYPNVIQSLSKPLQPEDLLLAIQSALAKAAPQPHPSGMVLFREAEKMVFQAHTGFFSLKNAIQMAYGDKLTGALRVFLNRFSTDLYFLQGRFVYATTRDVHLYTRESPLILSSTALGLIVESQANQTFTSCPMFLYLSNHNGFPHDDVVQITREHGQRLFSYLWTAGRIHFEFEHLKELPEFAKNFPASSEDPESWMLASLRYVKYDYLTAQQRPDPNGSPAYTRKGYEMIQKLKLNDVEARFATAINGSESLQSIAKKLSIPLNDALLIVFRFQMLDIIDYWNSSVLSLPPAQTNPGGGANAA
jgi:CheY-like chemotaxis protein